MSSFMKDVRDELKTLIIATIPSSEATTNNVIMSIAAARENLFEAKQAGKVTLPLWILDIATLTPEQQHGSQANNFRAPLKIIEIRKADETDAQITVQDHLVLIEQAIRNSAHTSFCPIEQGAIGTGPDDPAMAPIIDLGLNFIAGTLSYLPGLLCGDY